METTMIGISVHPDDEARLESVITAMQANSPGRTDDECVDLIFRIGLEMIDTMRPQEEPTL